MFRALLKELAIDNYEAVQLTDTIRDWADKDTVLVFSLGAEDAYYEVLKPPYLTTNQWMMGKDELRTVHGVTAKVYAKLAPYVCALPNDKLKININTMLPELPELLAPLYLGKIGSYDAKWVLNELLKKGWKETKLMTDQLPVPLETVKGLKEALVVKSDSFEAYLVAEIGNSRARREQLPAEQTLYCSLREAHRLHRPGPREPVSQERCVSEGLVIRLGTTKQQPVAWLVWSSQEQEIPPVLTRWASCRSALADAPW